MQNCFREHPDIYGAELDEDEVEAEAREQDAAAAGQSDPPRQPKSNPDAEKVVDTEPDHPDVVQAKRDRSDAATAQVKKDFGQSSDSESLVPKAAHDARGQESKGAK
jgi:intermembrane space import and assembly protein 40